MNFFFLFLFSSLSFLLQGSPVKGHLDMQVHLTTHMLYPHLVSSKSPLDAPPQKEMSHKHTRTQAAYEKQLWESSTSLYIITALDTFFHPTRKGMMKAIKDQFYFVRKITRKYPDRYAIAKNPDQAREIIHSGRKAFILAIEGATKLIQSQEDAYALAAQGVAIIGIIHLQDNEYGDATLMGGFLGALINPGGLFRKWFNCSKRGLTRQGKKAVRWLTHAGILTDINHMSKKAALDTLKIIESMEAPVVATHTELKSVTGHEHGLTDDMVKRIYRSGGMVALSSGNVTPAKRIISGSLPRNYCPGSYQELGLQGTYLQSLFPYDRNLVIGFATDMNGMVDHYRPQYGPKGCFHKQAKVGDYFPEERRNFTKFDIYGLNNIGAVRDVWRNLQKDSFNTNPFMGSAEGFLKVWERISILSLRASNHFLTIQTSST